MSTVKKLLIILMISIMGIELMTNLTYAQSEKDVSINAMEELWQLRDEFIETNYNIAYNVDIESYVVSIEKVDNELPEGIKILDEEYQEKTRFEPEKSFKIIIPWTSLTENGNFKINIEAKGRSGEKYYDSYIRNYELNRTSIFITKENLETGEFLEGVGFEILNSKREVVYSNLLTNERGNIYIDALIPGKYYIREISTIKGYELNEEEIEVEIAPYDTKEVTFNGIRNSNIQPDENENSDLDTKGEDSNQNTEKKENENLNSSKDTSERKENLNNNIEEKEKIESKMNGSTSRKLPVTGM